MTVGFYAPLPPANTGVADYAAALLEAMRRQNDVAVNEPGDVSLYQLGNNGLHRQVYDLALRRPGVVILHDAVLHHFFLGALSEGAYISEFVYNYGAWAENTARQLWASRARSASDPAYFRYAMLRRIAERSRAVIVHNAGAAEMVRRHSETARVRVVPHLHVPRAAAPAYVTERLRSALGVRPHEFLFGVFGHLRESKRLATVIRAFHTARHVAPMKLLVAGEFVSDVYARAMGPMLAGEGVIRKGRLDGDDFIAHIAAVDACINLRYPSAGETSGIAITAMGAGKPVLISDSAENDFPDETCVRVSCGMTEQEELSAAMIALASRAAEARAIGACARENIRVRHDTNDAARRCLEVLRACYYEFTPTLNPR